MVVPSETPDSDPTLKSLPRDDPKFEEGSLPPAMEKLWGMSKRTGVIFFLLIMALMLNIVWVFQVAKTGHTQNDFAHYFASSKLYLEGREDIYRADLRPKFSELGWDNFREEIFYATNPPTLIRLFSVYALLPPRSAYLAWMLTQLVALSLAIALTYETVRDELSGHAYMFVLAVFLFLPFLLAHLMYSQVQLLLLLLVLIGFRFLQNNRGLIGCLFVVAAALLKLFPIVLLPWFVWRSGNTAKGRMMAGIVTAVAFALGLWLTDLTQWKDFSDMARPRISEWVCETNCFSLASLGEHVGILVSGTRNNTMLFRSGILIGILLLVSFQIWVMFRRSIVSNREIRIELAIMMLLMLFCGVTCWWHYLVFLLFPLAVAATCLKQDFGYWKLILSAVVVGMMIPLTASKEFTSLPTFLLVFSPLLSMIAMAIYLFMCLHRSATSHGMTRK